MGACEWFCDYILGIKIHFETDEKPLVPTPSYAQNFKTVYTSKDTPFPYLPDAV